MLVFDDGGGANASLSSPIFAAAADDDVSVRRTKTSPRDWPRKDNEDLVMGLLLFLFSTDPVLLLSLFLLMLRLFFCCLSRNCLQKTGATFTVVQKNCSARKLSYI